jgi:hypothetical protein
VWNSSTTQRVGSEGRSARRETLGADEEQLRLAAELVAEAVRAVRTPEITELAAAVA